MPLRSQPLRLAVRGVEYLLPAPTRDQVRRCMALEPGPRQVESIGDGDSRRASQLAILAEGCPGLPLDILTAGEEAQIIAAIADAHADEKEKGKPAKRPKLRPVAERLAEFDRETVTLAALLRRLPCEADAAAYLDSVRLLEEIHEHRCDEVKFQAAIHGCKLK